MSGLLANLFGHTPAVASSSPAWSFPRLQQLYDRLNTFRESHLEKGSGGDAVVETVRQVTEALIWGQENDSRFFDFFCEKNILADFVRLLGLPKAPRQVKVQLLQTLSVLVSNIRSKTSVYYLLSNNHINRLITTQLDFEDEEILAIYISFLKSLAIRLDQETIKFFFLQLPEPSFPLYIEAIRFFDNRDNMVRTTVRNITLQVYRIDDPAMRRFVLRHAAESYFSQLALHLRALWLRLEAAASNAETLADLMPVQREYDTQQDLLIYLSDVFDLQVEELNEVLADRLLNCAMLPLLLTGVMALGENSRPSDAASRELAPGVALFLIRQVFDVFQAPCLLSPLSSALLNPSIPAAVAYVLPRPMGSPMSSPSMLAMDIPDGDDLPNSWREHYFACLRSVDDAIVLLAATVLHACCKQSDRTTAPAAVQDAEEMDGEGSATSSVPTIMPDRAGGVDAAAHRTLIFALERHCSWQPEYLLAFLRILLEACSERGVQIRGDLQQDIQRAVASAAMGAAGRLQGQIEACKQAGVWDALLDLFCDGWDWHQASLPDIGNFCGNVRLLLPMELW